MSELEVLQWSAKGCGYATELHDGRTWIREPAWKVSAVEWNPFTNAEQRWECVRKLLEMGCAIELGRKNYCIVLFPDGAYWERKCPAEDFPARALAELTAKK